MYTKKNLFMSIMLGKSDKYEEIIKNCDVKILNSQKEDNKTVLHLAIIKQDLLAIRLLLSRSEFNINAQDKSKKTALYYAVEKKNLELVELLLQHGANPNILAEGKTAPLHAAAIYGEEKIVGALLKNKADPNIKDDEHQTPLYLAAHINHAKIGKMLLDHGADPSIKARISYESTPLELLLDYTKVNTKEFVLLLLHNDKVNVKNITSKDLTYAEIEFDDLLDTNHTNLIQALFKEDIKSYDEATIFAKLKNSVQNGANKENITLLLNDYKITPELKKELLLELENIDLNTVSKEGYTPLHIAAFNGDVATVKYLIEKGANVNAQDKTGATPLHSARSMEVAKILLNEGANINAQKDGHNKYTPLDVILLNMESLVNIEEIKKQKQLVEFFIDQGANLVTSDNKEELQVTINKLINLGIDQQIIISSLKKHNVFFDEETKIDIIKNTLGFDKKSIVFYYKLGVDMNDTDEKQLNIIIKNIATGKNKDNIAKSDILSYDSSDLIQDCFFKVLINYDQDTAKLIGNDIF